MVNRESNYNRRMVSRLKSIRDKKRNRFNRVKKVLNAEEETTESRIAHENIKKNLSAKMLKKQAKKQKNIEKIYKELAITTSVIKDKHAIKRRNKRGNKVKNVNMDID